ncbi:ATP/GTP-binding protein [Streptomyces albireticuli]|uniref:ATP/GTP-binding protein n=1 Tax=Streptomyces albireticuli TaxID=1940 RepID=A0A1Z2LEH2_9ACTN|nr:hypothetical protein [Streptomyces albireticuli]ARZ72618.1 ATP/GTP-binding protein [Streptomyces albireticuli]
MANPKNRGGRVRLTKDPGPASARSGKKEKEVHVARAELALALPDYLALREVPLRPDPLEALAAAVADVREDLMERVDVVLDLVPVSARAVNRKRQRLLAQARLRP